MTTPTSDISGLTAGFNVRGGCGRRRSEDARNATRKATQALLGDAREVAGDEHLDLELGPRCLVQRAAGRAVRRGQSLGQEPVAILGRVPDRDGLFPPEHGQAAAFGRDGAGASYLLIDQLVLLVGAVGV